MSDHTNDPSLLPGSCWTQSSRDAVMGHAQPATDNVVSRLDGNGRPLIPVGTSLRVLRREEQTTERLQRILEGVLARKIEAVESIADLVTVTEKVARIVTELEVDLKAVEAQSLSPITRQRRINAVLDATASRAAGI